MMLASLAMYDFRDLRAQWNALYDPIHDAISDAPSELKWGDDALDWSKDIFLSMTCGAPFRNDLAHRLHLVGTFDFGIIDGMPAYYNSVILGKIPTNRMVRLGVNDMGSQSGYHATVKWLINHNINHEIILTGAHKQSMERLAEGSIDICGIDAVSHRFITQLEPSLRSLPILGHSESSPGLPLVTSFPEHIPKIREILERTLPEKTLGIRGIVDIPRASYLGVQNAVS